MKNIPPKIYLQVDADGETPEDFKELEVTWATDRIFKTDIEYVLATKISPIDLTESEEIKYYIEVQKELAIGMANELGISEARKGHIPHNNL